MVGQITFGALSIWSDGVVFGGGAKAKALWKYHRLSGYILFSMLLMTTHLAGTWSNWAAKYTAVPIRLIAYTVAPAVMLIGTFSRVRLSKMKFF
jgi:cytochrome b-561 domain-containing protein 2